MFACWASIHLYSASSCPPPYGALRLIVCKLKSSDASVLLQAFMTLKLCNVQRLSLAELHIEVPATVHCSIAKFCDISTLSSARYRSPFEPRMQLPDPSATRRFCEAGSGMYNARLADPLDTSIKPERACRTELVH